MLEDALKGVHKNTAWVDWLITDENDSARSTLDFLKTCFMNVPAHKQNGILGKLRGDEKQVEATIYELVAHELLLRVGLSPEFEPLIGRKTPDLSFVVAEKRFLADVYLTYSPSRTLRVRRNGIREARDTSIRGESRAHKIVCEIEDKVRKYKCLGLPLVIFVFLGDHELLDIEDVERALFGMTAYETGLEERFPDSVSWDYVPVGGLLLPDDNNDYHYKNLSAVIACDWFTSLNKKDQGKRLHCFVLHNWAGDEALPTDAFKFFPQIIWNQTEPSVWKPEQTISRNSVAKFTLDGEIEYGVYTADDPW